MPRRKKQNTTTLGELIRGERDPEEPLPTMLVTEEMLVIDKHEHQTYPHTGDYKYSLERVQAIVNAIVQGMPARWASQMGGIVEATYYEWKRLRPDFAAVIRQAEAIRMKNITESVMRQVPDNWAAGITMLERLHPADFGRKDRIEHVHQGEVGLNVIRVLESPDAIAAASAMEAALQQAEELPALPAHEEKAVED